MTTCPVASQKRRRHSCLASLRPQSPRNPYREALAPAPRFCQRLPRRPITLRINPTSHTPPLSATHAEASSLHRLPPRRQRHPCSRSTPINGLPGSGLLVFKIAGELDQMAQANRHAASKTNQRKNTNGPQPPVKQQVPCNAGQHHLQRDRNQGPGPLVGAGLVASRVAILFFWQFSPGS